jgi:hypothetical protein
MDIDKAAYEAANLPTSEPVLLGSGSLSAKVGIMGRDPGRQEIMLQEPFVGAGGRLLRAGLHSHHHGSPPPDHATARLVGRKYFWCNTVPYKPTRNRAWSVKIKRRFAPIIADYIVEIVHATRAPTEAGLDLARFVEFGASPRATIALAATARAHAFLEGRGYVTPDDVKAMGPDVLRHRVLLTYEAEAEGLNVEQVIEQVFQRVKTP